MARRIFPEGNDEKGRPYDDLRWSRFKNFEPAEMFAVLNEHVFPFPRTLEQLKRLEAQLAEKDEKLSVVLADKDKLSEELKRLRKEVTEAKKAAAKIPDDHDYSEAETRDYFIDLLLKEAGWPLDQKADREFSITEMPNSGLSLRESIANACSATSTPQSPLRRIRCVGVKPS